MQIDLTRPQKLYRYSEKQWLERSIKFGEFRIRPAADYYTIETDRARNDDEMVRIHSSPGENVVITDVVSGARIKPLGDVTYRSKVGTNYLTLCFSKCWNVKLFGEFPGTDACLVIHKVEEFSERVHLALSAMLPDWIGMDAAVSYGRSHALGAVFMKPPHPQFVMQHEWRFAWRPAAALSTIDPIRLKIDSIERIAEIVERPASLAVAC